MIEPKPGVSLPPITHVIPERVHLPIRMQRSDRVDPALIEETFEKRPSLGLHERVILVGFRRVNVRICWHDIVIPCQHDWRAEAV